MDYIVSKANQAKMVLLLQRAKMVLGSDRLISELLRPPLQITTFSDHDTGCQISISLASPGKQLFKVWEGSIWYSSGHLFNDDNKVLGLNPKYDFVEPELIKFFDVVQNLYSEILVHQVMNRAITQAKASDKEQEDLEHYRQLIQKRNQP